MARQPTVPPTTSLVPGIARHVWPPGIRRLPDRSAKCARGKYNLGGEPPVRGVRRAANACVKTG
eukprot:4970633-Amphidinium_carterae.1